MSLGTNLSKTAARLIQRYGATGVLRQKGQADLPISMIVESFDLRFIDGERIRQGDLRLLIAGKDVPRPVAGDYIHVGDTTQPRYVVVDVESVYAQDQVPLYIVQVRR